MTSATTRKPDLSWLGILLAVVLFIPGYFVGWIASYIYQFFILGYIGENWLFKILGIEFLNVGLGVWFVTLLHGFLMGAVAGGGSSAVLNHFKIRFARNVIVYSSGTLLVAFGALAFASHWHVRGIVNFASVALIALVVGGIIGLAVSTSESAFRGAHVTVEG